MKIIGLCGAAGAGKDTVARMMRGYRAIAFADKLREEVAEAFGVDVAWLADPAVKNAPQREMALIRCDERFNPFIEFAWNRAIDPCGVRHNTPREVLQWWGDWRASQDPDYFRKAALARMVWGEPHVFTDVRFANEAALVRQLGGEIWQIVRPGVAAGGTGHKSDNDGSQFAPDRVIENAGTLQALEAEVLKCLG